MHMAPEKLSGRPTKCGRAAIDKKIREEELPEDLWMNREQWRFKESKDGVERKELRKPDVGSCWSFG